MSESTTRSTGGYQPPDTLNVPPLYDWPPRPLATLRWIFTSLLFPWGFLFIGLAFFCWHFLTPSMTQMAVLEPGWIALVWLRNAILLTAVAGGLHWWLYVRRGQDKEYKFNTGWLADDDDRFLWRNQARDNMFWSLVSGCTIWTLYESLTYWWYSNGHVQWAGYAEAPLYLAFMLLAVFFYSTIHFYLVHRLMHWPTLYKIAHELHHRNVNTGPWTGISMHPVEHVIYFSVFMLWWVVPVHPVVIVLTGFFQGISPSISHSGFDRLVLGGRTRVAAGDQFHHLHHRFFHINYGNLMSPLDKVFGSWHDGGEAGRAVLKERMRRGFAARTWLPG